MCTPQTERSLLSQTFEIKAFVIGFICNRQIQNSVSLCTLENSRFLDNVFHLYMFSPLHIQLLHNTAKQIPLIYLYFLATSFMLPVRDDF